MTCKISRTHAHAHTRSLMFTHAHAHVRTHTHSHIHIRAHTHAHAAPTCTLTHTRTHTHTTSTEQDPFDCSRSGNPSVLLRQGIRDQIQARRTVRALCVRHVWLRPARRPLYSLLHARASAMHREAKQYHHDIWLTSWRLASAVGLGGSATTSMICRRGKKYNTKVVK